MLRRAETPPRDPRQIIEDQAREIERLREDLRPSEAERQRPRRENEKLREELDAARRAVYRQAAPFSRGTRVARPCRPGRKAARRLVAVGTGAAPRTSTKSTPRRSQPRVRTVTVRCARDGSPPKIKKSCPSSGGSCVDLTSTLASASNAGCVCKGAIRF